MNNRSFSLDKELADQDPKRDHVYIGGISPSCIYKIPEEKRTQYLPKGENQNIGEEKSNCATRCDTNILRTKFNYAYRNGLMKPENAKWLEDNDYVDDLKKPLMERHIDWSDSFNAILSGTTADGNSMKAPLQSIHEDGLIPKKLLPQLLTFKEEYNPERITKVHRDLGHEFLKRWSIKYDQPVGDDRAAFLAEDQFVAAVHAYPVMNFQTKEYPRFPGAPNHALDFFKRPAFYIFDNYDDDPTDGVYVKKLASDYDIYYPYRPYVAAEFSVATPSVPQIPPKKKDWLDALIEFINAIFNPTQTPMPPPEPPKQKTKAELLSEEAVSFLGKDASPKNLTPMEFSCAEGVSNIIHAVIQGFPADIEGTDTLYFELKRSKYFVQIPDPVPGCVVVSPRTAKVHGHCGIYTQSDKIASNDSKDGLFRENYTRQSWKNTFITGKGLKGYFFKPV